MNQNIVTVELLPALAGIATLPSQIREAETDFVDLSRRRPVSKNDTVELMDRYKKQSIDPIESTRTQYVDRKGNEPTSYKIPKDHQIAKAVVLNRMTQEDHQTVSIHPSQGDSKKETVDRTPLKNYLSQIQDRLEKAKRYPWLARLRGQEGIVRLKFMIKPSGEPWNIQLIQSSHWEILDDEAFSLVKRVGRFPVLPSLFKEGIDVEVPVVFELEEP